MIAREEIIVGLLQPHAPAELRVIKLVVRALQKGPVDLDRLVLLSKRERALPILAWIVELVPLEERTPAILDLLESLPRAPAA